MLVAFLEVLALELLLVGVLHQSSPPLFHLIKLQQHLLRVGELGFGHLRAFLLAPHVVVYEAVHIRLPLVLQAAL